MGFENVTLYERNINGTISQAGYDIIINASPFFPNISVNNSHFGNISNSTNITLNSNQGWAQKSLLEIVSVSLVVALLASLTIAGNLLVIIAFRIDKQLQTITNYFLLSLAVADLAIGIISMPLYTVYLLMGHWPLGPLLCDLWLSLDYVMSNASAANLLVISFDRYLSVTRPLTYRANRTGRKAVFMILLVWLISILLWTPWIFAWPHIEGERTVPEDDCYIQFLSTNVFVTIGTHIIAFWCPVIIMTVLYFKIFMETKKRQKRMPMLQAYKSFKEKKACSIEEDMPYNGGYRDSEDIEGLYLPDLELPHEEKTCWQKVCCCKIDRDFEIEESSSSERLSPMANSFPDSNQSFRSYRSGSLKFRQISRYSFGRYSKRSNSSNLAIPLMSTDSKQVSGPDSTGTITEEDSPAVPKKERILTKIGSTDSTDLYTILIDIPKNKAGNPETHPTIKMIDDNDDDQIDIIKPSPPMLAKTNGTQHSISFEESSFVSNSDRKFKKTALTQIMGTPSLGRRTRSTDANKNAQNAKIASHIVYKQEKSKKKRSEKKQDQKAARTLSAILLAFIVTWLPYQITTIIESFCSGCVPVLLYKFSYWFCYINSTINPLCYALCNANFRRTFLKILKCSFSRRGRKNHMVSSYSFTCGHR